MFTVFIGVSAPDAASAIESGISMYCRTRRINKNRFQILTRTTPAMIKAFLANSHNFRIVFIEGSFRDLAKHVDETKIVVVSDAITGHGNFLGLPVSKDRVFTIVQKIMSDQKSKSAKSVNSAKKAEAKRLQKAPSDLALSLASAATNNGRTPTQTKQTTSPSLRWRAANK